jgi:hypothetical protein
LLLTDELTLRRRSLVSLLRSLRHQFEAKRARGKARMGRLRGWVPGDVAVHESENGTTARSLRCGASVKFLRGFCRAHDPIRASLHGVQIAQTGSTTVCLTTRNISVEWYVAMLAV